MGSRLDDGADEDEEPAEDRDESSDKFLLNECDDIDMSGYLDE
jgi:hypothetical protein